MSGLKIPAANHRGEWSFVSEVTARLAANSVRLHKTKASLSLGFILKDIK